jgi:hypothetical protein
MWAVDMTVQRLNLPHAWRGWASSSTDATDKALDDARCVWRGFSFVVRTVLQVGV